MRPHGGVAMPRGDRERRVRRRHVAGSPARGRPTYDECGMPIGRAHDRCALRLGRVWDHAIEDACIDRRAASGRDAGALQSALWRHDGAMPCPIGEVAGTGCGLGRGRVGGSQSATASEQGGWACNVRDVGSGVEPLKRTANSAQGGGGMEWRGLSTEQMPA